MTATKISYATCPLCEATCGLKIETRDREIVSIRGDAEDVFSHGYICPKAYSLKELHADPDCIREPWSAETISGSKSVGMTHSLKSNAD